MGNADTTTKFESVLAKRLAEQKAKAESGQGTVGDIGSNADKTTTLDPKLAKRLAEQQAKAENEDDDAALSADNKVLVMTIDRPPTSRFKQLGCCAHDFAGPVEP